MVQSPTAMVSPITSETTSLPPLAVTPANTAKRSEKPGSTTPRAQKVSLTSDISEKVGVTRRLSMKPPGGAAVKFDATYELAGPDCAENAVVLSPWNQSVPADGELTLLNSQPDAPR